MKNRTADFLILTLLLLTVASFFVTKAAAQSGRKNPEPTTETPNTKSETQIEKTEDSTFKPDKNLPPYAFVYPTNYEGFCHRMKKFPDKCFTVGEEQFLLGARSRIKNFVEQLNKLGEQGYRLNAIDWDSNPNGFVKSDETQFEYAWFETVSSIFFAKAGFEEKYARFAEKGFRIIKHSTISSNCAYTDPQDATSERCKFVDTYLLEKEKGKSAKNPQQILVSSAPGWGAKPSVELSTQINDKLAEDFYPIQIFSKFEILLEQVSDKDEISGEKPEIQVIRSDIEKKVSELAKQGFRLELVNDSIAVMVRRAKNVSPIKYIWLKADNSKFRTQFASLVGQGAIYHGVYPNATRIKKSLIFEHKSEKETSPREYEFIELDFSSVENKAENRIDINLKPTGTEALKRIDELRKQGFKMREILYLDKLTILLEREKTNSN